METEYGTKMNDRPSPVFTLTCLAVILFAVVTNFTHIDDTWEDRKSVV